MSNRIRASDNTSPAFIEQLRAARVEAQLSQRDLAAQLGWSTDRLRVYEEGSRGIHPRILAAWAAALGLVVTCVPAGGDGALPAGGGAP